MNVNPLWNLLPFRKTKIRSGGLVNIQKIQCLHVSGTVLCTRVQTDSLWVSILMCLVWWWGCWALLLYLGRSHKKKKKKCLLDSVSEELIQGCPFSLLRNCRDKKEGIFFFLILCRVKWCYHLPHVHHVVYGTVNWSWRLEPSDRWDMAVAAAEKQGKIAIINIWRHTGAILWVFLFKQFSKFEMIPLINHRVKLFGFQYLSLPSNYIKKTAIAFSRKKLALKWESHREDSWNIWVREHSYRFECWSLHCLFP